jgi:hypothetical protein
MKVHASLFLSVTAVVLAGAGTPGGAAEPAYNPEQLSSARLGQVQGICQNVLGLSPTERPSGGNWLGNSRLNYWTSHYQGCILSLSGSLKSVQNARGLQQSEAACHAKGLTSGNPDFAMCVLQSSNARTGSQEQGAAAIQTSVSDEPALSYYRVSPGETARREQRACAALGLSPAQEQFSRCVQGLRDTFYSIDHPIN